MAFVNLPPNLQDMFYALSDRIMKLETGPNQAMYTAESAQGSAQSASAQAASAQSVATQAQIQAINAGIAANNAAAQATIAQSQATIASTQATVAQATANGKNKVTYSTSAPGATANSVGDIWYQYGTSGTYANKVIAQFSGLGGTSWTSVTVSGLVIANIDAGTVTTGVLNAIQIQAGSGGQYFTVSPSGFMSAQGVYIKGNITADSGTFNGTIQAQTGYFGSVPLNSYWSIGTAGLTGVGTAVITGGAISGSSITTNAGTIAGWLLQPGFFTNSAADTFLYASPGTDGLAYSTVGRGIMRRLQLNGSSGTTLGTATLAVGGNTTIDGSTTSIGSITTNGNITSDGAVTFVNSGGTATSFRVLSTGLVRSLFTYNNQVSSARALLINSAGDFGNSTSTRRHKREITPYKINSNNLLKLQVKQYKYIESIDPEQKLQHGFIAEEAQALGLNELIQFDSQGIPDYFAYEKLPIFLLQLVQELKAEIDQLKGAK